MLSEKPASVALLEHDNKNETAQQPHSNVANRTASNARARWQTNCSWHSAFAALPLILNRVPIRKRRQFEEKRWKSHLHSNAWNTID